MIFSVCSLYTGCLKKKTARLALEAYYSSLETAIVKKKDSLFWNPLVLSFQMSTKKSFDLEKAKKIAFEVGYPYH